MEFTEWIERTISKVSHEKRLKTYLIVFIVNITTNQCVGKVLA